MGSPFCDVLVVEHDADVRQAVAEILREQGCRVYLARDGREALGVLRNIVPDLIVADLALPQMSELREELQQAPRLGAVPVAAVSASFDSAPLRDATRMRELVDRRTVLSLLAAPVSSSASVVGRRSETEAAHDRSTGGTSGTYCRRDFPELDSPPDERVKKAR